MALQKNAYALLCDGVGNFFKNRLEKTIIVYR